MGEQIERVSLSETMNLQVTVRRLQVTMAVSGILLILATWTLWTPHMVFPRVPLLRGVDDVPVWFEWLTFGLMDAALLAAIGLGRTQRWTSQALLAFAVLTAILIVIDQHRLQPWAYQFIILAIVFALATPSKALVLIRLLVVSIYVYSAVSKLDYSFLHTHGQRFLLTVCQTVGLSIDQWPRERLLIMTALFPITELVVGIALGLKRSRCWGLWGSLLLHGLLLVTLGPWGFGHKPGVLIWNVYFMIQNVLLFGPILGSRPGEVRVQQQPPVAIPSERLPAAAGIGDGVAKVTLAAVVLLPLLEPFGWWDRWPAWAVYATGAQRYRVYVHESGRERLPQDLIQYVEPPRFDSDWCQFDIGRWSLSELQAPVYPEARFQLGVAVAIARDYRLDSWVTVIGESAADRLSGMRTSWDVCGTTELMQEARRFRLNAVPRDSRR